MGEMSNEPALDRESEGGRVIHWKLEDLDHAVMARQSLIAMLVGTVIAGVVAFLTRTGAPLTWAFAGIGLAVTIVVSLVSLILHEGLHGVVMALFGAKPEFGAGSMQTPEREGRPSAKVPYFFATAPGHQFTPRQMTWVALVPTVVLSAAFLVLIALSPDAWAYGLVLPAGIHLSGCVGDWQIVGVVRRQPEGTLVEDTRDGMILHVA